VAWVAAVPATLLAAKQVLAATVLLVRVAAGQVDLLQLPVPTHWPDPATVVTVLLLS